MIIYGRPRHEKPATDPTTTDRMIKERQEMVVTLKEYINSKFDALEKAVDLAHSNLDARLNTLNELRAEVLEDRHMFVTRELYDRLQSDVDINTNRLTVIETRSVTWTAAMGVVFIILQICMAVFFYYLSHK